MSYRALRIPWGQHRFELLIAGVVLFWLVALVRGRVEPRNLKARTSDLIG
jgi:hypothetical protein